MMLLFVVETREAWRMINEIEDQHKDLKSTLQDIVSDMVLLYWGGFLANEFDREKLSNTAKKDANYVPLKSKDWDKYGLIEIHNKVASTLPTSLDDYYEFLKLTGEQYNVKIKSQAEFKEKAMQVAIVGKDSLSDEFGKLMSYFIKTKTELRRKEEQYTFLPLILPQLTTLFDYVCEEMYSPPHLGIEESIMKMNSLLDTYKVDFKEIGKTVCVYNDTQSTVVDKKKQVQEALKSLNRTEAADIKEKLEILQKRLDKLPPTNETGTEELERMFSRISAFVKKIMED